MGEVLEPSRLVERIAELKRAGNRIAFANGHFDMLHVGHLRYLQGAQQEGDILVVGINDDASVEGTRQTHHAGTRKGRVGGSHAAGGPGSDLRR